MSADPCREIDREWTLYRAYKSAVQSNTSLPRGTCCPTCSSCKVESDVRKAQSPTTRVYIIVKLSSDLSPVFNIGQV